MKKYQTKAAPALFASYARAAAFLGDALGKSKLNLFWDRLSTLARAAWAVGAGQESARATKAAAVSAAARRRR